MKTHVNKKIRARLLSPSSLVFSAPHLGFISLTHKRKKIIKCGELLAHSYSCGVAQQCDWLTTLPYVLLQDIPPFLFVSHCSFCFQTLAFISLSLIQHVYNIYKRKPLFFLPRITFSVSSRYKFIPLTFSLFLPSVSLHFQSTTVLDNASIRF